MGALLVPPGPAFSRVRHQLVGHAGHADLGSRGRCVLWRPNPTVQLVGGALSPPPRLPQDRGSHISVALSLGFVPCAGSGGLLQDRTPSSLPVCLLPSSLRLGRPPWEGLVQRAQGVAGAFTRTEQE